MIGGVPWGAGFLRERRQPTEVDRYVRREYGDPEGDWFVAAVARDRAARKARLSRWGTRGLGRLSRAFAALW